MRRFMGISRCIRKCMASPIASLMALRLWWSCPVWCRLWCIHHRFTALFMVLATVVTGAGAVVVTRGMKAMAAGVTESALSMCSRRTVWVW